MKEVILGRMGTQPFKIKNDKDVVGNKHAKITIDDHDKWVLQDLDSTNGTWIRNENTGELCRISQCNITPMTFICLGNDSAYGCCFYAKQAFNYGDFHDEHQYIYDKEQEYEQRVSKYASFSKFVILPRILIPLALFGITVLIWGMGDPMTMVGRMVGATIASEVVHLFYDPKKKKEKLRKHYDKFNHCPNPECYHRLTSMEIQSMRCSKCKK